MKQIVQNLSSGQTDIADVPAPVLKGGFVAVGVRNSLISLGTERMLVSFGKSGLVAKARAQPDKVKMVLEKAVTDGIVTTMEAVKSKLDQPIPMGYCSAGVVVDASDTEFKVGSRVVTNGAHAELVCVSKNLVAEIPDGVSFEAAAFAPVASIGLQGIRLIAPQVGEHVVVAGLGLIGLLTVQILVAQGCNVVGMDFDSAKLQLAKSYGAQIVDLSKDSDPVNAVLALTDARGVDAVLITASTKSSDPVSQAARMSRKRGKIVLVGVTGLELNRAEFYEKELIFQVSCSYGPGRYDPFHETDGHDYPYGFVRWTEKRNFEAVLNLMAKGRLNVDALVSQRFKFDDAVKAYAEVLEAKGALGIILEYPAEHTDDSLLERNVTFGNTSEKTYPAGSAVCGVLGAGNYASRILIPAFKDAGASLRTLVSAGGLNASHHGNSNGFEGASSDSASVFSDDQIEAVVIATRHDTHADLVVQALQAGKSVFVEKPLAIKRKDLDAVSKAVEVASPGSIQRVMVGFNRRFAPQVVTLKKLVDALDEPKSFIMTMNAGAIPADSWVQSPETGGGRIIGEACHYIDLMRHLAGSAIVSVSARRMGSHPRVAVADDKAIITLGFEDGSLGSIHYLANGGKVFPKERIEVFAGDGVLQLDNFRRLKGYGWRGFKSQSLLRQDKGQKACVAVFVKALKEGLPSPIPFNEIMEVSHATIDAADQLAEQP